VALLIDIEIVKNSNMSASNPSVRKAKVTVWPPRFHIEVLITSNPDVWKVKVYGFSMKLLDDVAEMVSSSKLFSVQYLIQLRLSIDSF